jgi:hypothetical protein
LLSKQIKSTAPFAWCLAGFRLESDVSLPHKRAGWAACSNARL